MLLDQDHRQQKLRGKGRRPPAGIRIEQRRQVDPFQGLNDLPCHVLQWHLLVELLPFDRILCPRGRLKPCLMAHGDVRNRCVGHPFPLRELRRVPSKPIGGDRRLGVQVDPVSTTKMLFAPGPREISFGAD